MITKDVYGIKLLLEIRERGNSIPLIEQTLCMKFPNGDRYITGWGKTGKDDDVLLGMDVKTVIADKLLSHDIHTRQKVGSRYYQAIEGKDWYADTCVIETPVFSTVHALEKWYTDNSTSRLDQFLNKF
jgi:hypothetical protein